MGIFEDEIFGVEPSGTSGVPDGGGLNSLFPSSAVLAYDFSDSVCYANYGDLSLQNVITSPADMETQATYDGTISAAENFQNELNKSNAYLAKGTIGEFMDITNKTTFINSMHKAGANWGVSVPFRTDSNTDVTNALFTTGGGSAGANNTGRVGAAIYRTSATNIRVQIQNGSGSAYALEEDFTIIALPAWSKHLATVGFNDTAGTLDLYLDGTKYSKTGVSLVSPSASACFSPRFFYGSGSDGLGVGSRMYGGAIFNASPDSTVEAVIRAAWETAHSDVYTI